MNKKIIMSSALCVIILVISTPATIGSADESFSDPMADMVSAYNSFGQSIGRITYDEGKATGTYVEFTLDETTGTVTDYMVKLTMYSYMNAYAYYYDKPTLTSNVIGNAYDSKIDISYVNITIFDAIKVNNFTPASPPQAFADYLVFQGKNTFMMFYDKQGGNTHYASSSLPSELTFTVPDTLKIIEYPIVSVPTTSNQESTVPPDYPTTSNVQPLWQTVQIKSINTTTSLWIYNGSVIVNGQSIAVKLAPYGYIDFNSWAEAPVSKEVNDYWYNDLKIVEAKTVIENAKETGIIPAEAWVQSSISDLQAVELPSDVKEPLPAADVYSNYYTYNDDTFTIDFSNIEKNSVEVIVNSEISTGRIVIINIDKEIIDTTTIEDLLIKIDDTEISSVDTLQELMEKVDNKDTGSSYYVLIGDQLTTVFAYVDHFSTHTISIDLISSGAGLTGILLPIVLSNLFIALIVGGAVVLKRKQRDDF